MDECQAFRLVQDPAGTRRRILLVEELTESVTRSGDVEVVDVGLKNPKVTQSHRYRLVPSAKMRFDGARQRDRPCGNGTARGEIHYFPAGLAELKREEPKNYKFRTLTIVQDSSNTQGPAE